jgi:hypothetical protein
MDRDALIAGYDALVATFPVFSRCSRDRFLSAVSGFCASWSRSTRHDLPNLRDSPPAPTNDEWPTPHVGSNGSSGLESGAADLQAQRLGSRGRAVHFNAGRMDNDLHRWWRLGVEPLAQEHSGRGVAAETHSEVIRVCLDLNPLISTPHLSNSPVAPHRCSCIARSLLAASAYSNHALLLCSVSESLAWLSLSPGTSVQKI